MRKLIIIAVLAIVSMGSANAGTYIDALKSCGTEWKVSDARKGVKKGEGMAAWQMFRKECTQRVGWTKKGK